MNTKIQTPKLVITHPNDDSTGAAIAFELSPAHGCRSGAIYFMIANQKIVETNETSTPTPAYDWDTAVSFRLGFSDVCKFLQVFRGVHVAINKGDGIVCKTHNGAVRVSLKHRTSPECYSLSVNRTADGSDVEDEHRIVFSRGEALGLACAFEGSMKEIAFGTSFEATSADIARDEIREITTEEGFMVFRSGAETGGTR